MKRVVILAVALATTLVGVTSCDKIKDAADTVSTVAQGGAEVDYQMLTNKEESKKWFDEVLAKAGENAKVMDEVSFSIDRPSLEGSIKREGAKDYLAVYITYQDPEDKRRVERITYFGHTSGWQPAEKMEIDVSGSDAENFKLEDYLFDFNQVSFDLFHKVITDAFTKYKDEAKYEYQYVKHIDINKDGFKVTIHGKLKSNGVEKSEYYNTDLKGNQVED